MVITISGSCFKSNKYLTSVAIEDGSILETIGDNAFADCTALKSFIFAGTAAKLTNIGKNTFLNDTALDKFTMKSVRAIPRASVWRSILN